jgi:hypothetical protein
MLRTTRLKILGAVLLCAAGVSLLTTAHSAMAQDASSNTGPTDVTVYVKEADGGEPVSQAAVTLQFEEPRSFGPGKKHTFNSKTDSQGRCKLYGINKGPITLMVTSNHHQSYGKQLQLEHNN